MAGLIDVAVLPKGVETIDEALECLERSPSHAFVATSGEPRVLHARDLLAARNEGVESVLKVQGRPLAEMPRMKFASLLAGKSVRSIIASGRAEKVFGSVFAETGADFLLAGTAGGTATLVTRSEVYEAELGQAACECDAPDRHPRDGQRSDTGKRCAVPGCPGRYRCY